MSCFLWNTGLARRRGGVGAPFTSHGRPHAPIVPSLLVGLMALLGLFLDSHRESFEDDGSSGIDGRLERKEDADALLHRAIFRLDTGNNNCEETGRD